MQVAESVKSLTVATQSSQGYDFKDHASSGETTVAIAPLLQDAGVFSKMPMQWPLSRWLSTLIHVVM